MTGMDGQHVALADANAELIAPSVGAVKTIFTAVDRAVATVGAECREISETLRALDDALRVVTGAGGGQDWGGFGLAGLPILGAIRAVKSLAGQYVKQQTGVPLTTWTEFVAGSSAQFESYSAHLNRAAGLSERYRTSIETDIDLRTARADLETLIEVRWRTQAWNVTLARVTQLGQVVDAILQIDLGEEPEPSEPSPPEPSLRLPGALQKRFREVQSRTFSKTVDFREWILHPFVEIRDRVRRLPAAVEQLSRDVALLEVLLDLELAEVQACIGETSAEHARIVGVRVATSVLLPELAREIGDARQRVAQNEQWQTRLNAALAAGEVQPRAHAIVSDRYRRAWDNSRNRLAELEARADEWRRHGPAILDACAEWLRLELDVLAARAVAEHPDAIVDQQALLLREQGRLEDAKRDLAVL